MKNQTKIIV